MNWTINKRTIYEWTVTTYVIAILTVTVILSGTFLVLAVGQITSVMNEQNRIVLNAVLDRTESFLEQTTSGMRELGNALVELSEDDEETLARIIDGVRVGSINLRSIDVIDPEARILYSSPRNTANIGNDVSGRDAYQRVISSGTPAWSRVFYADFLDDVVITFYVPAGEHILAGNLSLQRLWTSMENIDVADETRLSIIDSNGAYIYHSDLTKVEGRMFDPNRIELREAAGTGKTLVQYTDQGEQVRTQVETVSGTDWLVAVSQPVKFQRRAQNQLILAAVVVLVVTLAIGVLHIRRVARRNLEPFSRLQSIALRIADGEYDVEYPASRFVEITTLSESFRSMVAGITQREISLRDARDESERASQAKSELLANVSHEFRTSLNGILGMSSLLSKTTLDETQAEYLRAQLQAARVLARLVDDLLEVSRDEFSSPSRLTEVDLYHTITSFRTLLNDENSEVRFVWINDVSPGTVAKLDDERLGQIVMNLVSNARKYTRQGVITVCWNLPTEPENEKILQLIVRDTGIGIPPDERERVFDSFVQIDRTHTKTRRGLGLGLAIVKQACNLAGGTVTISDNAIDGRGTQITVRVPVELVSSPTQNQPDDNVLPSPAEESENADVSPVVLIVEDEAINRMYLSTVLKRNGYAVRQYDSGVQLINEQPFPEVEVILMDIGLPHKSGLEVAKELRDRGISIPIVALTAYSNQSDVETYREAHMNGFVAKPIKESVLFRVLENVLSGDEWAV